MSLLGEIIVQATESFIVVDKETDKYPVVVIKGTKGELLQHKPLTLISLDNRKTGMVNVKWDAVLKRNEKGMMDILRDIETLAPISNLQMFYYSGSGTKQNRKR